MAQQPLSPSLEKVTANAAAALAVKSGLHTADEFISQVAVEFRRHAARVQWEELMADPDYWFGIPEFGVVPVGPDFSGFSRPILQENELEPEAAEAVRGILRTVREIARRTFPSQRDLIAHLQTGRRGGGNRARGPSEPTEHYKVAVTYALIVASLEGWAEHRNDPTLRILCVAEAGAMTAEWALDGVEAVHSHYAQKNIKNTERARAAKQLNPATKAKDAKEALLRELNAGNDIQDRNIASRIARRVGCTPNTVRSARTRLLAQPDE